MSCSFQARKKVQFPFVVLSRRLPPPRQTEIILFATRCFQLPTGDSRSHGDSSAIRPITSMLENAGGMLISWWFLNLIVRFVIPVKLHIELTAQLIGRKFCLSSLSVLKLLFIASLQGQHIVLTKHWIGPNVMFIPSPQESTIPVCRAQSKTPSAATNRNYTFCYTLLPTAHGRFSLARWFIGHSALYFYVRKCRGDAD